jgi:hypothetical protein
VGTGAAPTAAELATRFGASTTRIAIALRALADDHGVVLHPHAAEVWVAHPFATAPTPFVVRRGRRSWWCPCAWCSLGAAGLLDDGTEPVTITTTLGGEGPQVTLTIVDGDLRDDDYVVHFPVPMRRAWDNVIHTCSVMLLFSDRGDVDAWCRRHRTLRGDVQPVRTVWEFARVWYGRHLAQDWRKWTAQEAADMFERFGLTGDTWALDGVTGRF